MRILVCVISSRGWMPRMGVDFAAMIGFTVKNEKAIGLQALNIMGREFSAIWSARQLCLDAAVEQNFTHIALFDDDMSFPSDTLVRLAQHRKQFVCSNVAQRRDDGAVNGVCLSDDELRINSAGKNGLEQVKWATLACTLIEVDAFKSIPKPHFGVEFMPNGLYQGEDHYFMKKLGKAGVQFWCDHDLSQQVKHIGLRHYGFDNKPTYPDTSVASKFQYD